MPTELNPHEQDTAPALAPWLAEAATRREELGLVRTTTVPDPGCIDLAGNDYLGLRRHPQVVAAAAHAALEHGAGAGASRLVTGTLSVHEELERALADHVGTSAALVLSTGYHANLAATTALTDAHTLVVSDAHNHASLIDGLRLSRATVAVAPHGDLDAVRDLLAHGRLADGSAPRRRLVVVESVYSVLGDASDLLALAALARAHGAALLVDDAHGLGVSGDRGEGLVAALGLAADPDVVVTTTLSKSLGSQGGAVLASAAVREHLVNTARPFIYDTGLAPAAAAGAQAALDVLRAHPGLAGQVRHVAARLAEAAGAATPAGAVLSVPMPGPREALDAVARAGAKGVRIGCFRPPSTPDGSSRLRLTAHAGLGSAELEQACAVLHEVTR